MTFIDMASLLVKFPGAIVATFMVARKILKKKVLVGTEAVDSRTMVDLRRPLQHALVRRRPFAAESVDVIVS